jgi:hypothetical protein
MFKTKNELSEEIRAKAVELFNARLADCSDSTGARACRVLCLPS